MLLKTIQPMLKKAKFFYKKSALVLGVLIPLLLLYVFSPGLNMFNAPLSIFGITESTQTIWIMFNQMMSITLMMFGLNANQNLPDSINKKRNKKILDGILAVAIVAFSASGMITMDIHLAHLTLAGIFFVSYMAYIFWYGYYSRNPSIILSLWATGICLLSLAAIAVTFIMGYSYGFFEVIFILCVLLWNILMFRHKKLS